MLAGETRRVALVEGYAGIRIAFLSNITQKMLEAGIHNSGLEGVFEHVLSTDRVKVYKPDPRAYQMGVDAFSAETRRNPLRGFCRMGRGWRQGIRLSYVLG